MSRMFPCPYCKGQYQDTDWIADQTVVLGECDACDYGMIEVGSPKHMEIKRTSVALKAIAMFGDGEGYSQEQIQQIGAAAERAVRETHQ